MTRSDGLRPLLWLPLLAVLLGAAPPADPADPPTTLRVRDMTFVGSRGDITELQLHAERAVLHPETNVADLEVVDATGRGEGDVASFEMRCDRAELDTETNDFYAEGHVRGRTGSGERYTAEWVRYLHEPGLLMSDAPVVVRDETGTFRGEGFRYHVRERRFELLGRVRMVQQP